MKEILESSVGMPYISLLEFIDELLRTRGASESSNKNSAILLMTAAMVEGFLSDLCYLAADNYPSKTELEDRLILDLKQRINESTWNEYPKYFKLLFNKEMNKCVDNLIWESIVILFHYRNFLIHGKPVIYETYSENGEIISEYAWKLNYIYKYLIKTKLVTKGETVILTSKITNHLFQQTIKFIILVFEQTENQDNLIIKDSFYLPIKKYIST
jgi:hypothetical protein